MSSRPEKCPTRCEGTLLTLRNTFIRLTTLSSFEKNNKIKNRGSRRTIPLLGLFSLFVHSTNMFELSPYARRNKIIRFAARNKLFLLIHLDITTMTLHKAVLNADTAPCLHVRRKLTMPRRLFIHADLPSVQSRVSYCLNLRSDGDFIPNYTSAFQLQLL